MHTIGCPSGHVPGTRPRLWLLPMMQEAHGPMFGGLEAILAHEALVNLTPLRGRQTKTSCVDDATGRENRRAAFEARLVGTELNVSALISGAWRRR